MFGFTWLQLFEYFLVYSCLGWCTEVVFAAVTTGEIVNRGFLNGPVCPIYGFGMLTVLAFLTPIQSSGILLFLGGAALTTAIELLGGWALYKLFHARWWDYSDKPFNLGGYICLEFTILWGLGVIIIMRVIHPTVAGLVGLIPHVVAVIGVICLCLVYAADTIVTLCTVNGLNRDLGELEKVASAIHDVSDAMTNVLATTAMDTDQALDESKLQLTLAKSEARDAVTAKTAEMRESAAQAKAKLQAGAGMAADKVRLAAEGLASLQARKAQLEARADYLRKDVVGHYHIGGGRLLQAFPDMKHSDHRATLEALKDQLYENRHKGHHRVSRAAKEESAKKDA